MPMLRQSVIKTIHSVLEESYFSKEDFSVRFPDSGRNIVNIKFLSMSYSFEINETEQIGEPESQQNLLYETRESPGDHFADEHHTFPNLDECIVRISSWCENIHVELSSWLRPIHDEFEEVRRSFEEQMHTHTYDPNAHFSKEEIERLQANLDDVIANIERLQADNEISREEFENIRSEISSIRADLNSFPKGAWHRTAFNKLLNIGGKFFRSKAGQLAIERTARALLEGNTPDEGQLTSEEGPEEER